MHEDLILLALTMLGIAELRLAVRRYSHRVNGLEKRLMHLEAAAGIKHHARTVFLGLVVGLLLAGCDASAPRLSTALAIDNVEELEKRARGGALTPVERVEAKAAVVAAEHKEVAIEKITERHDLLRMAVLAIGVVSLCVAGSSWFPLLAYILKPIAAAAGLWAALLLSIRSLLSVPEWINNCTFGAAALIAVVMMVRHAVKNTGALHEIATRTNVETHLLSGKAKAVVGRIGAWVSHHHAPVKGI